MIIETKYNIGDKVWYTHSCKHAEEEICQCPVCKGTGHNPILDEPCTARFTSNIKPYDLYQCRSGTIVYNYFKNEPAQGVIMRYRISDLYDEYTDVHSPCIRYVVTQNNDNANALSFNLEILESELFDSFEECQAACRNS